MYNIIVILYNIIQYDIILSFSTPLLLSIFPITSPLNFSFSLLLLLHFLRFSLSFSPAYPLFSPLILSLSLFASHFSLSSLHSFLLSSLIRFSLFPRSLLFPFSLSAPFFSPHSSLLFANSLFSFPRSLLFSFSPSAPFLSSHSVRASH